jgi:hypothetical protein
MSPAVRNHLPWVLLVLLLGCSGDPTGPNGGGTLAVTIQGLPTGSAADVSISGPGGFARSLTASQTFTGLTAGSYTVTATGISVGGATYQASPGIQTVAVVQSGPQATASVTYATPKGSLAITINGLGTSGTAAVTVTGPNSYNQAVTTTRTLRGLTPGTYTVSANGVTASCGSSYSPAPGTQDLSVSPGATTQATVSYNSTATGQADLCVDGMYVTQSAQNYAGTVPLVANRNGLVRVFVVASQPSTPASTVKVQLRFLDALGGTLDSTVISAPLSMVSVPMAPDESSLGNSWNYSVAGSTLRAGMTIEAKIIPGGAPDAVPGDNVLSRTPTVKTVPTINVTFVPIVQKGIPAGHRLPGNVTTGNAAQFMQDTKDMHPIDTYNTAVHAAYTTTTMDTLESENGNSAWGTILGELDALRTTEASSRYYYGVAKVSYTSGVAGVAYVSDPSTVPPQVARAALGWDYLPTGSVVAAHELGHNWARNHSPCGGPTGVDPNYPQPDGTTGGYGYSLATGTLHQPNSTDIMAYCDTKWISEYTYSGVLNYFSNSASMVQGSTISSDVQPCLLVWGHIRNGEVVLEPAFQVNTRPSLPLQRGPYSLEGKASDGSSVFNISFAANQIADAPGTQENFAFAVPMSPAQASRLASLHLNGGARPAMLASAAAVSGTQPGMPNALEIRRAGSGRVALRWDARAHPMIMVRDPETGEVLSFARGGDAELSTRKGQVDLVISDGVKSTVRRALVAP